MSFRDEYIYSWSLNVVEAIYLIQNCLDLYLALIQIMESKRL